MPQASTPDCCASCVHCRVSKSPEYRLDKRNVVPDSSSLCQPSTAGWLQNTRWMWAFLSFRGFLLRMAAGVAARLRLGGTGARLALAACAKGEGFVRPPWPPGAMPPVLLVAS
ncbi:unnamed protein product [Scytosiphon promiscuus]